MCARQWGRGHRHPFVMWTQHVQSHRQTQSDKIFHFDLEVMSGGFHTVVEKSLALIKHNEKALVYHFSIRLSLWEMPPLVTLGDKLKGQGFFMEAVGES